MTDGLKISLISETLEVGTRPCWDSETNLLYFVDVPTSLAYKYNPANGEVVKTKVGSEPLGFMIPVEGEDNRFIAGLGRKLVFITWDGRCKNVQKIEYITEVDWEEGMTSNRFNAGKVDPYGRLWAGTMGPAGEDGEIMPGKGALYSYSKGLLIKHEANIGISNGMAWDIKENKMYYIDTMCPVVFQYDYDPETGTICNKKSILDFEKYRIPGKPDGLSIDKDGNILVACIFGGYIIHFDPKEEKVLHRIPLPTSQVTALTFGGFELDKIFVTTAKMPEEGVVPEEPAGSTLVIEGLDVSGVGDFKYRA